MIRFQYPIPKSINLDEYIPEVLFDVPTGDLEDYTFTIHKCYSCEKECLDVEGSYSSYNKQGKPWGSFRCHTCQIKRYKDNDTEREKRNLYSRNYVKNNKEQIFDYSKEYRRWNKDIINKNAKIRQSLHRKAIPSFLKNCPIEKIRLQNIYKLRDCFTKATQTIYHVDHMWPLSDGGPHWSGNLAIITAQENLTKHAKVNETIKKSVSESLNILKKEYEKTNAII